MLRFTYKDNTIAHEVSESWIDYFMSVAEVVARKSKDPNRQVGCIAVDQESKRILTTGYNGFPSKVEETEERWQRPVKYDFVVHAEANVIASAARFGINLQGCSLFVLAHPCIDCTKLIASAGIKFVYYLDDGIADHPTQEWHDHLENARAILSETGIQLIPILDCKIKIDSANLKEEWTRDNPTSKDGTVNNKRYLTAVVLKHRQNPPNLDIKGKTK